MKRDLPDDCSVSQTEILAIVVVLNILGCVRSRLVKSYRIILSKLSTGAFAAFVWATGHSYFYGNEKAY